VVGFELLRRYGIFAQPQGGIATLRPTDDARVFVTSLTFGTGDARYGWLNTLFGVLEGVLDTVSAEGLARGRAYWCEPSASMSEPARG
jgi:hypothetical protein